MSKIKQFFKTVGNFIVKIFKDIFINKNIKERIQFLNSFSIFKGLTNRELANVYLIMYSKEYAEGEIIFEQGKQGKAIFFIAEGEIEISRKSSEGEDVVVIKLKEGDFFGEMALLEEVDRTATARVVAPAKLYFIYKSNFDGLLTNRPRTGIKITKNLFKILSIRLNNTRLV